MQALSAVGLRFFLEELRLCIRLHILYLPFFVCRLIETRLQDPAGLEMTRKKEENHAAQ